MKPKISITRHDVADALLAVFGMSETQKSGQDDGTVRVYTYDDIPADGDGEINGETGFISHKRIPKPVITARKKAVVVISILLLIGASLTIGFTTFGSAEETYEYCENIDGRGLCGWQLKYFSGASSITELHLRYAKDSDGSELKDRPLVACASFSASNSTYLKTIYIGPSVSFIGYWAFCNNSALENIFVDPENKSYCDVDGVLFTKDMKKLVCYPMGKKAESYVIPETVTAVGTVAFYKCEGLKFVTLPASLEIIEEMGFFGCSSLSGFSLPDGLKVIGKDAFSYCGSLPDIIFIPASVREIGTYAFFECGSIDMICLENRDGVTKIGDNWLPKIDKAMFKTRYPQVRYGVSVREFIDMTKREGAKDE